MSQYAREHPELFDTPDDPQLRAYNQGDYGAIARLVDEAMERAERLPACDGCDDVAGFVHQPTGRPLCASCVDDLAEARMDASGDHTACAPGSCEDCARYYGFIRDCAPHDPVSTDATT